MTKLEIIKDDITTLKVDAIVNAANKSLLGGGGVDGAIHRAAGPKLLEECKKLGGAETGEAKITKGFQLPADYVIHTVGPVWNGGNNNEDELLKSCYENSLKLTSEYNIKNIAFPSISTGVYHFPIERAAKIALATVDKFVKKNSNLEKVIFCTFSESDYETYKKVYSEIINDV